MIPAKGEFLFIDEAIIILVKDLEDVARLVLRQGVNVPLIIPKQRLADQTELIEVQLPIARVK